MFLAGGNVNAGVHGTRPDLADLDEGDLKFQTDFRSVYATILKDWFAADAKTVLGGDYKTVPLSG